MGFHQGSWLAGALFAAVVVLRLVAAQRRAGARRGRVSSSSFTDPPARPTKGAREGTVADRAAGGVAPGWFADPFFRHEQRYWSGTAWTEHVSDQGVPGSDPPPGGGRPAG